MYKCLIKYSFAIKISNLLCCETCKLIVYGLKLMNNIIIIIIIKIIIIGDVIIRDGHKFFLTLSSIIYYRRYLLVIPLPFCVGPFP